IGVSGREVAVRVAGSTVVAISDSAPPVGARVALAVRPEKIGFREGAAPAPQARLNVLEAQVRDVTFVGEMHRYALEVAPGVMLVTKQQHRFHVRPRAPQEHVMVEWHIEDTLIV